MSNTFQYQPLFEVSRILGEKDPVIDDVLSSTNEHFILMPHLIETAEKLTFKRER